nr:hypothetical protein [Hydrococcus sp. Prado102]
SLYWEDSAGLHRMNTSDASNLSKAATLNISVEGGMLAYGDYLIFSNRLHVLMFAMRCDSIPIAVIDAAKEEKIVGIFSDAGLKRLILDIDKEPFNVSILPEIAANSHQIKEEIAACFDRYQDKAETLLESIFS